MKGERETFSVCVLSFLKYHVLGPQQWAKPAGALPTSDRERVKWGANWKGSNGQASVHAHCYVSGEQFGGMSPASGMKCLPWKPVAHLLGQTNILQTKARASGSYSEPQGCCAALRMLGPQHQAEPGRPVSLSTSWAGRTTSASRKPETWSGRTLSKFLILYELHSPAEWGLICHPLLDGEMGGWSSAVTCVRRF